MLFLYPSLLKNRITDITPADLRTLGVRGLLLDVDNTLTAPKSQALDPAVRDWLDGMAAAGIALTVVSNGLPKRVRPFAQKIGLRYIAFACKPSPIGFWRGARRLALPRRQCAAVGDQTFTDVLGARLAGVKAIQVMPRALETAWSLRLKRWLETGILARFRKREARRAEKAARDGIQTAPVGGEAARDGDLTARGTEKAVPVGGKRAIPPEDKR